MARVTVEDCVLKVPNRFELVLLASQRAREITSGAPLTLDRDDDKNPVVALREIADETVGLPQLRDAVVRGMQKQVEIDEPEETPELEVDPSVFGVAPPAAGLAAGLIDEPDLDEEEALEADEEAGRRRRGRRRRGRRGRAGGGGVGRAGARCARARRGRACRGRAPRGRACRGRAPEDELVEDILEADAEEVDLAETPAGDEPAVDPDEEP